MNIIAALIILFTAIIAPPISILLAVMLLVVLQFKNIRRAKTSKGRRPLLEGSNEYKLFLALTTNIKE